MTDRWPPEGHAFVWRVEENFDGSEPASYEMSLPDHNRTDIATARVLRLSGPGPEDQAFRRELYAHLGAILVAGGHAEAAMKRTILVLNGASEAVFSTVDSMTWTRLEAELRKIATRGPAHGHGPTTLGLSRIEGLGELRDWAAKKRMKCRRDSAIHAYWWDYAGCGVRRARFELNGSSRMLYGSFEMLEDDYRVITQFATALDDANERAWPQIRLPAAGPGRGYATDQAQRE